MFEHLEARAEANAAVKQQRRFADLTLALHAGSDQYFVRIDADAVRVTAAPVGTPDVTLWAEKAAWTTLFSETPPPGYQTLSSMQRIGALTVEGNLLAFHQHLMLLESLFCLLKPHDETVAAAPSTPYLEPVLGRYLHVTIAGRAHRLYFEEAGSGIPLLCLHTAGADGRQYRAILNDHAITDHYRVIVFDLPWHGKSSPPIGFEKDVYQLTTNLYVDTVMAVSAALHLEKPVVMGCSIGGRAVLHLALRHGAEFRAAIGLQSALYAEHKPGPEQQTPFALNRPDIHAGQLAGASMAGLIAPQSPNAARWETMWHYMQGGPGVFLGDLFYYFTDGDMRNGIAAGIDPNTCPIYLLSGDYDTSATPEMGQALAEEIGATHFEVMRGVGHFPMSENPDAFRGYLLPVLENIKVLD